MALSKAKLANKRAAKNQKRKHKAYTPAKRYITLDTPVYKPQLMSDTQTLTL